MIRLIGIYLATGDWASMFREKYATDDSNVYARTLRREFQREEQDLDLAIVLELIHDTSS